MELVHEKNLVEIWRVTPSVYFRKGSMAARRQSNGVFIVSEDAVAAVDATTMEAAQEMMEESLHLFGQPLRYVFLTHGDGDHVNGLPFFLDQPITVFCSHRLLGQVLPAGTRSKAAFVAVDGTMRLRLGALEVELATVQGTAAHSPRDMFVRVPAEQAVCVGDVAVDLSMLHFHAADVENWIATLRGLSAQGSQYILPGHGEVYPHSHLDAVAGFMEILLRTARRCLEPLTQAQVLALDEEKLKTMTAECLSGSDADAQTILQKAENGAERELRTVIQSLVRKANADS